MSYKLPMERNNNLNVLRKRNKHFLIRYMEPPPLTPTYLHICSGERNVKFYLSNKVATSGVCLFGFYWNSIIEGIIIHFQKCSQISAISLIYIIGIYRFREGILISARAQLLSYQFVSNTSSEREPSLHICISPFHLIQIKRGEEDSFLSIRSLDWMLKLCKREWRTSQLQTSFSFRLSVIFLSHRSIFA